MRKSYNKYFKGLICIVFLFLLFESSLPTTIFANENIGLEVRLERYLMEHEESIAGLATIVIDEDEVIYKVKGYSNVEEQKLVDENTVFEWASVSKVLIWISVMQLVEAGLLDLEADIAMYLPDNFPVKTKFEEPITMLQLMHHTAGFDDSYTDLMIHQPTKRQSLREALEMIDVEQVFPPGDIVAYSNYSSGLAAYIVEEVSGIDYQEYVIQYIFEPLEMTKTAIDLEQNDNQWVKKQRQKIEGYSNTLQLIEPNLYNIPIYPVGSVMGTAEDLQKLLQALLAEDGSPLFTDEKTIDQMFEPTLYYPETNIPRIANGLFYLPAKSKNVYGHGGNSFAFSSSFYLDRKDQLGVLVLTNVKDENTFTSGIPEIIFGEYPAHEDGLKLENSLQWEGIYEPARLPRHGFSRVHGLFLRSTTKPSGSHDITINDLYYSQLEPSIYKTEDIDSMYALDVYSKHPEMKKILSNTYSDLLYVSYYKHILEWGGLILGLLAIVFSIIYIITTIFRRTWNKKRSFPYLFTQHFLNLLMLTNVIWILYQTLSMVSYVTLKPFLILNLIYIVITLIYSGFLITKIRNTNGVWKLTIIFALILCSNLLYWEFYF